LPLLFYLCVIDTALWLDGLQSKQGLLFSAQSHVLLQRNQLLSHRTIFSCTLQKYGIKWNQLKDAAKFKLW
jgi:hypothetical protein